MTQDIACPVCGTELTLAQLFANEDTQRAFARLASVSIPLGSRVLQYCTLFAPAKTPEAIISRLNQEVTRYLKTPEAKERFFSAGTEAYGSTPEHLASVMKSEMARLGKLIKEAGIQADD